MTIEQENAKPCEAKPDELRARTEALGDQLRAKIASKFQTSTFLAGFAATILSIEITMLWDGGNQPGLLPLSVATMVAALILYTAAIIKLDELTLPKRFWEEDCGPRDRVAAQLAYLEQDDLWELHKRMVFFWYRLTITAAVLSAISLGSLLAPCSLFPSSIRIRETTAVLAGTAVVTACAYLGLVRVVSSRRFGRLRRRRD